MTWPISFLCGVLAAAVVLLIGGWVKRPGGPDETDQAGA